MNAQGSIVTGVGVHSAAGSTNAFLDAAFACDDLHRTIPLPEGRSLAFAWAALSPPPSAPLGVSETAFRRLDPFAKFAVAAADEATRQAGLFDRALTPDRIAVIIGTANAGISTLQREFEKLLVADKRPHALTVPRAMGNAAASAVAALIGARGPCFGLVSACASGAQAIAIGHQLILTDTADIVIAGGADSCASYGYLKAWEALRAVSPAPCRPFDRDRNGLSIGDGAGVLVLERSDTARRPLARLAGTGMTSNADEPLKLDSAAMAAAMWRALATAKLRPRQIGYVNAHGTGTEANDRCEAEAITSVFGPPVRQPRVSSTKSCHGHMMGAAGAVEAAIAIEALIRGKAPRNRGLSSTDPACPVNAIFESRLPSGTATMTNSFALGGPNCSLVFSNA